MLRNFRVPGRLLRFATIPPDNNCAEAALRQVALGRKNFFVVGNEEAGHDLAVLYTLVASCEEHGVNPSDEVTDVLMRVYSHPARLIYFRLAGSRPIKCAERAPYHGSDVNAPERRRLPDRYGSSTAFHPE